MNNKKHFADFMQIRFKKIDHYNLYSYVGCKKEDCKFWRLYSTIVAQFETEEELERFEEEKESDEFDVNEFVSISYANFEKLQYILYTDSEDSFDELVKIFNNYECILYQFVIVTTKNEVVYE